MIVGLHKRIACAALVAALVVFAAGPDPARAQDGAAVTVPNFWDPSHREEAPDLSEVGTIRFITEAQNPPFSFIGADGVPTGFNVEIARALCQNLGAPCTIQTLRWDLIEDAIDRDRGDAIIAGIAIDEEAYERFSFSTTYLSRPARFAVRRDAGDFQATPEGLAGRKVAVLRGTAHEAYLRTFFPGAAVIAFDGEAEARGALRESEVAALFGDGVNIGLWLNGAASQRCCAFRGGPYTESRYFGEGMAIAVARDDERLRDILDYALARVHADGTYAEIFLRYFPLGLY